VLQAHYVIILNHLYLAYLIMENHSLGSTPVQCIAIIKGAMLKYGMLFQFRVVSQNARIELTIPHYLYAVPDTGYLL